MMLRPLLAALLLLGSGFAQDPAQPPRLGLVLSGGGARGFAHVGVLQVLEELRVPVDCVVGTSMGSIIGALYAYGYDPYEIERVVLAMDWEYLLQDSPLRTDLAIRRRLEQREYQINLTVGVRDGHVALPKGLVQGQNLGFVLDGLLIEAHALESFDRLQLPFRCVAADIGDGSRVVFDRGDLARAIRASMALPGVFAPVAWQGRLLVDGGIIDNLPVQAARDLGARQLIAVDIGTPPMRPDQIQDLLGITSQMVALLTQDYVDRALASLTPNDVLVQPQLGELTSVDFAKGAEFIRLGREYALRQKDALQRFAVGEAEFAAWRVRHRRLPTPLPVVRAIEVKGSAMVDPAVVTHELDGLVGAPLDLDRLRAGLERTYGLALFELLRCRVLYRQGGTCVLEVEAIEKSWGPGFLTFGMAAGTDFAGGDAFTIGTRYVQTGVGPLGAEWATDLRLGTHSLVRTEWFQPLESERSLFVAPRLAYGRAPLRAPVGNSISEFSVQMASAAFDLGSQWLPGTELRFGVDRGLGEFDVDAGIAPPGDDTFDDGGLHLDFVADTLDRSSFPTSGVLVDSSWRRRMTELGADSDYETAKAKVFGVTSAYGQVLALRLRGQWELAGQTGLIDVAQIGGLFDLSGLGSTDLVGAEGGVASLITYRRLGSARGKMSFPVYVGASVEAGGVWEWSSLSAADVLLAGSLFVGIDSPLGPIFVAYGQAEAGQRALYFTVGQMAF